MSLEEQHEPAAYVDLLAVRRQSADLTCRSFLRPLEHELQGLRPLVIDAEGVGIEVRPYGGVTVTGLVVLQAAEAPARTQRRLLVDEITELNVSTIRTPQVGAVRRDAAAREAGELKRRAKTLPYVPVHNNRQVCEVSFDTRGPADRTYRVAAGGGVRRTLPRPTRPEHVLVLAGFLVVRELCFEPRDLGDVVGAASEHARLEQPDAQLRRSAALRAVRHLCVEIGIEVPIPDAASRRAARLAAADSYRAHAEQGHVVQNVLPAEQRKLAACQHLAPGTAERQVDLTHVDLRAELIVRVAEVLDLRREPEVHGEVHARFLAARLERREGGEQAGTNAAVGRVARYRVLFRERPEGIHIAREGERPTIGHLHRELGAGRRGQQHGHS